MKAHFLLCFSVCLSLAAFSQHELWGTVSNGGQYGHGYLFKTDSAGNNLVVVHHFDSVNGLNPGALLAASNNKLYGLTASGGQLATTLFNGGVFFEYDLTTSQFSVIQHFGTGNPDITGTFPDGDGKRTLTEVSPGLIYGQVRGAYLGGNVFAYNANTHTTSLALTLPTYQGGATNQTMGNWLEGTLYRAPDGFLYGSTYTNSQCPIPNPYMGSIVRINPANNAFSIRYLPPCLITNGYQFESRFTSYNNILYSVTKPGGANNFGVIYAFNPASSSYEIKHSFEGGLLGERPTSMVTAANGKFYGLADGGQAEPNIPYGGGILFEFDPVTDTFIKKADFLYADGSYLNVGPFPFSLIAGQDGKLYGVTANGVFEYDPAQDTTTAKGRFPLTGGYPAASPSLTAVCRKPSYAPATDSTLSACSGSAVSFELQSDNTNTYTWSHDGIPDASQTTASLTFTDVAAADAGTWICTLSNACGISAGPSIELVVQAVTTPQVTQDGAELHATTAPAYQWINCANSTPIAGATGQVFAPVSNGSYAVITTTGSCTDTSACYLLSDLGLPGDVIAQPVLLFPNPATTEVQLLANESVGITAVTVLSTTGQVVMRSTSPVLGVMQLDAGTYFVVAETTAGRWYGRFVKVGP